MSDLLIIKVPIAPPWQFAEVKKGFLQFHNTSCRVHDVRNATVTSGPCTASLDRTASTYGNRTLEKTQTLLVTTVELQHLQLAWILLSIQTRQV